MRFRARPLRHRRVLRIKIRRIVPVKEDLGQTPLCVRCLSELVSAKMAKPGKRGPYKPSSKS